MKDEQLKEWLFNAILEVEKHNLRESERAGINVSWAYASTDWLRRHFQAWQAGWSGIGRTWI